MAKKIRTLFSTHRPIDRAIEKVIDYYAQTEDRLAVEIDEYEVTDNVEACFGKFLEAYDEGIRAGRGDRDRNLGVWLLRLGQEFVHQIPRLRPRPEPQCPRQAFH